MTGGPGGPGTRSWAEDWVAIWQSEWRALATDRELAETAVALTALWGEGFATAMAAAAAFTPSPTQGQRGPDAPLATDCARGRSGSGPPAGAAPVVAASDAGLAARRIAELAGRVEELERRLAGLEPPRPTPDGV